MIKDDKDEFAYLRKIDELFTLYVNQVDNREDIKKEILKNIKESKRFDVGSAICESSDELVRDIGLMKNEVKAMTSLERYKSSLKRNTDEDNYVLLEIVAETALLMAQDSETYVIDNEKKNIWLNVFKNISGFPKLFDDKVIYWQKQRAEIWKKHSDNNPLQETKETVESFKITMPMELNALTLGVKEKVSLMEINNEMVVDLIKSFNDFKLNEYMDLDYVNKLTLQSVNDNWEFVVDCNKHMLPNEKAEFMEELVGQLVDGWGEGQEQKYKLIGNKEYNLYFDYKTATIEDNLKCRKKINL